jgi:D-alanine transaminase
VIDLASELGIPTTEAALTPAEAMSADEAFITGTTREITPVTMIDDTSLGGGTPGTVTRRLMDAFRARTN